MASDGRDCGRAATGDAEPPIVRLELRSSG